MRDKKIIPIYVFSLPRSGSTLLQRMLMSNPLIASTSEPWLLLPLLYSMKMHGSYSEYEHYIAVRAIEDFCKQLPYGEASYKDAIRELVLRLYGEVSHSDACYFLDKTPRYHLVAEKIVEIFPQGKFILLWRNPLAIAASMMDTWAKGKWKLYTYKVDLYQGMENLINLVKQYNGQILEINYEEIVKNPELELSRIFKHLGVGFSSDQSAINIATEKLFGRLGDPTGILEYDVVSRESLNKWKITMSNPLRKYWCRRYLNWLGEDRLALMGYNKLQLLSELDAIPFSLRYLFTDILRMPAGVVYTFLEPVIYRDKFRQLRSKKFIHAHR